MLFLVVDLKFNELILKLSFLELMRRLSILHAKLKVCNYLLLFIDDLAHQGLSLHVLNFNALPGLLFPVIHGPSHSLLS